MKTVLTFKVKKREPQWTIYFDEISQCGMLMEAWYYCKKCNYNCETGQSVHQPLKTFLREVQCLEAPGPDGIRQGHKISDQSSQILRQHLSHPPLPCAGGRRFSLQKM